MTSRRRIPVLTGLALLLAIGGCATGSGSATETPTAAASPRPSASAATTAASPTAGPSVAITHGPMPPGVLSVIEGDAPLFLKHPNGVAIGSDGSIWVHDSGNFRILRFDPAGAVAGGWGKKGDGPADFSFQGFGGVALDGDDVLVVDNGTRSIKTFTADGTFTSAFGSLGEADGQFLRPVYVAVGPEPARLRYVTDDRKAFVQVFDRAGTFLRAFGGEGTGPGQFKHLTGIAIAADGTVAVADYELSRIQLFDAKDHLIGQIGGVGTGGHVARPDGVAVDDAGRWYVSNTSSHLVDVFSPDGTWLASANPAVGSMQAAPAGIAVTEDGSIWVADANTNVVAHLAPPTFSGG